MDNKTILEWVNGVCAQAVREAEEHGNPAFLNRMAKSGGAFPYYFTNVFTLKSISPEQFAGQFSAQMKELATIKEEYDARETVVSSNARIETLESKFDKLAAQLEAFIESQKPVEAVKKSGKKAKVSDPEAETGDDLANTGEGEASEEE